MIIVTQSDRKKDIIHWIIASIAARRRFASSSVMEGEAAAPDSAGLPMTTGAKDATTDAGRPAEVSTPATD